MKVKKLFIYGYGKWVDAQFDFSDNLHIIYGENEAGKSTLLSFIHSILFGFPSKISSELRYEPKIGSQYGGKIIIEDQRYGLVEIERIKGKGSGEVSVLFSDGSVGSDDKLSEILYGMNKDWYNSIFSLDLEGLRNVHKFNRAKLERYFLSAGTLGTERYLEEADKLNKDATKLFKPTGRVPEINKKLMVLKKKQTNVNRAKESFKTYNTLKKDLNINEEKLSSIELTIEEFKNEKKQKDEIKKYWNQLNELEKLRYEVEKTSVTFLPKDGLYQLQHYNKELATIQKSLNESQTKLEEYQQVFSISKELRFYQKNNDDIKSMLENSDFIREKISDYQHLMKENEKAKSSLYHEQLKHGFPLTIQLPIVFAEDEMELIERKNQEIQNLKSLREKYIKEQNHSEYKKEQLLKEIDELEMKLHPPEKYNKAEFYYENDQNKNTGRSVKMYAPMTFWVAIIGLSMLMILLLIFSNNKATALVSLIALAGISFKHYKDRKFIKNKQKETDWTYEEFIHQKEWRKNWQEKLAELDNVEREILSLNASLEKNLTDKETILKKWNIFLEKKQIPNSFRPIDLLEGTLFEKINQYATELNNLEAEIEKVKNRLDEWVREMQVFEEFVNLSEEYSLIFKDIQQLIEKAKNEKNQKKENIAKIDSIKYDLNRLVKTQRHLLNEKMMFLKKYEVSNEEEMKLKYKSIEDYQRKKDRMAMIQEQVKHIDETVDLIKQHSNYQTSEQLEENIKQLNEKIRSSVEEVVELRNDNARKKVEIDQLEKDGTLTALMQDLASEQAEIQELVDAWVKRKLAAALIEKTLSFAKKDRTPQTIEDASIYFSYLTMNKYRSVHIEEDRVNVLNKEGQFFGANELSRGTAEQLYISLRLAFIKNIEDKMMLPILIDEGFVNFDSERNDRMWDLLQEFSVTHQILFFTFNRPYEERLSSAQITML
ncbi:ATP-binding protein [Lacticigenium naphthae]|uniref:ATP-binding protein n=1 Tax=Lacticigenium naphthae TaxID=515351 RepID=UPI0004272424|nr:AAA family ATPase [Lacticigenium naphthae]